MFGCEIEKLAQNELASLPLLCAARKYLLNISSSNEALLQLVLKCWQKYCKQNTQQDKQVTEH